MTSCRFCSVSVVEANTEAETVWRHSFVDYDLDDELRSKLKCTLFPFSALNICSSGTTSSLLREARDVINAN
jgi:hypothetical protein